MRWQKVAFAGPGFGWPSVLCPGLLRFNAVVKDELGLFGSGKIEPSEFAGSHDM